MNRLTVFFSSIVLVLSFVACNVQQDVKPKTICNPLNISYRFQLDKPSRREAADPCIIRFQDKYILFASKCGGYWYSSDLIDWNFVETDQIPTEEYAPTAIALGDTLYFLASSHEKSSIYKSTDPFSGKWSLACEALEMPVWGGCHFDLHFPFRTDIANNFIESTELVRVSIPLLARPI